MYLFVPHCAGAGAVYIRYQHLRGEGSDHRPVISLHLRNGARESGQVAAEERGRVGLFTKTRSIVGLDIGSSAVKAVELKPAGKGFRVAAFGSEPVPPDSIVDGAIIDGTAVAEAIRRVFESKAFKTKEVVASLSGNAVIVKKISLPVMTATELDESIYWEAEQYIPFDIQDVNLDYQILDSGGTDSKGTMEVLLVAAKKDKIADYTGVIAQAGRTPVVVDVDAFALQNAFELNYGFEPKTVVVLLNAGASAININIIANEQSVFTRDISLGGNAYTEAVQRELNLPFESAELLKKGRPVDGATFEDVLPVLRAMTENVLLEVQKTFDFFKATASTDHIDRIMLSGGASRVEGFAEALQERFGTHVEMFDPFRKVTLDAKKYSAEQRETIVPTAAVAVGLALRRAGDR
jgi:type IV pilus assembly protein PilM